jgi:hypothetical protein
MRLLLFLLVTLSFLSCTPSATCRTNQINPVFIGFTESEIDTIILRKYTTNGNFSELLDTMLIDMTGAPQYTYRYAVHHDSTIFCIIVVDSSVTAIGAGYDWRVYIPSRNKTISISEIENGPHVGIAFCPDPVASFQQDGLPIVSPEYFSRSMVGVDWWLEGYRAYIHP